MPILQNNLTIKHGKAESLACCLALSKHNFPPDSALRASVVFALKLWTGPEALVLSKFKIERLHMVSCYKATIRAEKSCQMMTGRVFSPCLIFSSKVIVH